MPCLACLGSFPGVGTDGQRHTRVLTYWWWQQLAATIALGQRWGQGMPQQGVLAHLRRDICLSQQWWEASTVLPCYVHRPLAAWPPSPGAVVPIADH